MYFPRVDCFREDAKSINGFGVSARVKLVVASFMQPTAVFLRGPNAP